MPHLRRIHGKIVRRPPVALRQHPPTSCGWMLSSHDAHRGRPSGRGERAGQECRRRKLVARRLAHAVIHAADGGGDAADARDFDHAAAGVPGETPMSVAPSYSIPPPAAGADPSAPGAGSAAGQSGGSGRGPGAKAALPGDGDAATIDSVAEAELDAMLTLARVAMGTADSTPPTTQSKRRRKKRASAGGAPEPSFE